MTLFLKKLLDWDAFYQNVDVKHMPWYYKPLDPDLELQIFLQKFSKGKFLDIGTGPGTQAKQIAELGFDTTGIDISKNAIQKAKTLSKKVRFIVDDILTSSFPENSFDFILDRGCFHALIPNQRKHYRTQVKRLLKNNGILFLKVMSDEEKNLPPFVSPYKFSKQEIYKLFEEYFEIIDVRNSDFQGTLHPWPKAIFFVFKQKY